MNAQILKYPLIKKTLDSLTTLAFVAAISTTAIFYLKKTGFLGTSKAIANGFYHLFSFDVKGFLFALSIVAFIWLVSRYAFYLAIWLIIWVFYNAQILKFIAAMGIK